MLFAVSIRSRGRPSPVVLSYPMLDSMICLTEDLRQMASKPPPRIGWPVITLAIDPGKVSGAAIFIRRECVGAWACKDPQDRRSVIVEWFKHIASHDQEDILMRPLVVAERWSQGPRSRDPKASANMLVGLGAAWGRWQEQLEIAGVSSSQIMRVYPQKWKAKIVSPNAKKTEIAMAVKSMIHGIHIPVNDGYDAYDACGIGTWASMAPEVGEKIPKRVLKRYGYV